MITTFIISLIIAVLLLGYSVYSLLRDVKTLKKKLRESVTPSMIIECNRDFEVVDIINSRGELKLTHQNFCFKSDYNFTAEIMSTLKRKGSAEFPAKYKSENGIFASKIIDEGKTLYLKYKIKDLHNQNGIPTGYIIIVTNTSESEFVVPASQQSQQTLTGTVKNKAEEDSSKLFDKFKTIFLTNVNHEIRTPLNTILGFTDLLLESDNPKERAEYKNIIKHNSDSMLKYINDILDLSRIEAGKTDYKLTKFDIKDVLGRLSDKFEKEAKKGVSLNFLPLPEDSSIIADKECFEHIVSEFISNAVKYTTNGEIKVEYEFVDDKVNISVTDTGIGIEEKDLATIFNCFLSSDTDSGMSLTICKSMIEKRGGEIGAYSTKGTGSTFWILMPYQTELSAQQAQIKVKNDKFNLLVAEDNDSNFLLINSILKDYNVTRAENGQIAVDYMKDGEFDAVVMDIRMPVMDGIEATETIRKFDSKTPIIALSAHTNDGSLETAMARGCNEYLTKPIDRILLCNTLHKYCTGQAIA